MITCLWNIIIIQSYIYLAWDYIIVITNNNIVHILRTPLLNYNKILLYNFENLCVARCRHDYGLRTSLAKEVKGQMSIVTVFTRRFGPI